ncbi:MAG: hypothetical protein R3F61_08745 [Myxococcota bacterium]
MSSLSARLDSELGSAARTHAVPSLVIADRAGLLIASAPEGTANEEVAALAALRADGHMGRSEVVEGRVKAREVHVGDDVVVMGAIGDTAICAAVFDEVEDTVRQTLG